MSLTIKKVAVLGGGIGSISAVYELLKAAEGDKECTYEITLYQLGWRLGGKGASGRNKQLGNRIEEHGLHMWFGMYNNAFNQIKAIYNELNRPPGTPLATWKEAFTGENWLAAEEWFDNEWHQMNVKLPVNEEEPGGYHEFLTIREYLETILSLVINRFRKTDFYAQKAAQQQQLVTANLQGSEQQTHITHILEQIESLILKGMYTFLSAPFMKSVFIESLEAFLKWVKKEIGDLTAHNQDTRCAFVMLDAAFTCVMGILKDGVLVNGFDSINQYDLCEWMTLHGACDETINSAFIRGAYNAMFAFEGGDPDKPNIEAGTALRAAILGFSCKGSVMYKMNAGMGDVIFAPAYEVLKKRGVTFKFFHNVKTLELSSDKKNIQRIRIGRQVTLIDAAKEYYPLVDVKGLPCWPNEPLYEQITPEEAAALQSGNINLESAWTPWQDKEEIVLEFGKDFDIVIYGMPVGTVPYACAELMEANDRFKQMAEGVKTTQTQAFQLWMNKDVKEAGWQSPAKVMGAYVQPLDTWSEMNQVLDKETWPASQEVKSISYFCGPMKDGNITPPFTDVSFPERMKGQTIEESKKLMQHPIQFLWPAAWQQEANQFNWNYLVDVQNRQGEDRLKAQYFRANIDPAERYVLTVKGSSKFRIRTNNTGFSNLFITGDWIDNGFNFGCIEATVIAGMQCAEAVSGRPITIVGESILREHSLLPAAPAGLYEDIKLTAREKANEVKDDPQARIALREKFYEKYGDAFFKGGVRYGHAELSFISWEASRGVLNPLTGKKLGSPWWYYMNLEFIYWGELAVLVHQSGYTFEKLDDEVKFWLEYINKPSSANWYRAHNRSIASGYILFADLVKKESFYERIFINEVLYRLLYVGCLEMGPLAHLPFQDFFDAVANPSLGVINIIEKIPDFYPDHYPMTKEDATNIVYEGSCIGDKLDKDLTADFIQPYLTRIFRLSAEWLKLPQLALYAFQNIPAFNKRDQAKGLVKGKVQSLITLAELESSVVAKFLPEGLQLSQQEVARPGHHPVFIFYNQNRLHASFISWPSFLYNEIAILIPYVNLTGQPEVYAFTPILYVDSKLVAWLGEHMWKFNKLMANFAIQPAMRNELKWFIDVDAVNFQVSQNNTSISVANCKNAGEPTMLNGMPHANILKEMLNLPGLMGRDGTFAKVTISMDFDTATIQPASGEILIQKMEGIPVDNLKIEFGPITENVFGGCRIIWDITLSSPQKITANRL